MLRLPIRMALIFAMSFPAASFFFKGWYEADLFDFVTAAHQSDASIQNQRTDRDRDVIDEAAEPADPAEQARREAKNRRYNNGGQDLLTLSPDSEMSEISCGVVLPLLPISSTSVIILGTVVGSQPYLTEDRSSVYSEYMIRVEEFLKTDGGILPLAGANLVVDRRGGFLRLRSGRVIRYHASSSNMARPLHTQERCILFLNRICDEGDLYLGKGFLLDDGKAYTLGEQEGRGTLVGALRGPWWSADADSSNVLSDEEEFIRAVRLAIENPPSPRFHSKLDMSRLRSGN